MYTSVQLRGYLAIRRPTFLLKPTASFFPPSFIRTSASLSPSDTFFISSFLPLIYLSPLTFLFSSGSLLCLKTPLAMAAPSLGKSFCASCSGVAGWNEKVAPLAGGTASSSMFSPWRSESRGQQVVLGCLQTSRLALGDHTTRVTKATKATSVCVPRSMRWWEKGTAPNMTEIGSAQELVDSLLGAGDRLVVVDFYSPGCGGCKALHPKICQFADSNPDALFLKVNYEEHKSMCYGLNVHVLPFFRFYRGAQGRVCSFSCTNATIKKFKDAMAKHGSERRDPGPAKGLEESELLKLVSNGDLQFDLPLVHSRVNDLANNLCGSLRGVAQEAGEEMAALAL